MPEYGTYSGALDQGEFDSNQDGKEPKLGTEVRCGQEVLEIS